MEKAKRRGRPRKVKLDDLGFPIQEPKVVKLSENQKRIDEILQIARGELINVDSAIRIDLLHLAGAIAKITGEDRNLFLKRFANEIEDFAVLGLTYPTPKAKRGRPRKVK